MSNDHSLTLKVKTAERHAHTWVTDADIFAGDYYMHEFTDEPVIVVMSVDDARELHAWLTTVIERSNDEAAS